MNTENTTSTVAPVVATTPVVQAPPMAMNIQAEIDKRVAAEIEKLKASVALETAQEYYGKQAKALVKKAKTLKDVIDACNGQPATFVNFILGYDLRQLLESPMPRKVSEASTGTAATARTAGGVTITEKNVRDALRQLDLPQTINEIAEGVAATLRVPVTTADVKPILVALVELGQVETSGQKRGTRYLLIDKAEPESQPLADESQEVEAAPASKEVITAEFEVVEQAAAQEPEAQEVQATEPEAQEVEAASAPALEVPEVPETASDLIGNLVNDDDNNF